MTSAVSASARTRRTGGSGLLMVAPALLLFGLFGLVPLVGVVALSLARWDGLGSVGWAGFGNWSAVLADGATWQALGLTMKVMAVSWLVQTPIALALGVFQAPRGRTRALFAVLFFLPLLLSAVAIGLTWQALLDPSFGIGATPGLHERIACPVPGSRHIALGCVEPESDLEAGGVGERARCESVDHGVDHSVVQNRERAGSQDYITVAVPYVGDLGERVRAIQWKGVRVPGTGAAVVRSSSTMR
ncbi:carbohydrate ABC transporter permease [Streptomyces sp. NBC_00199]|uniref:carbohydrate ABC transporter permease n=1 Tax=Streptomyces sp. NBC_00199 TaxID=2975678 RepID=UPI00225A3D58|nr:hypothetical protein [Streptomyces sp. NBC_00199]MCX5262581.1 hypothetical protein [Streptomyces sp. NBC_00199]